MKKLIVLLVLFGVVSLGCLGIFLFKDETAVSPAPQVDDAFWIHLDRNDYHKYYEQLAAAPPVVIVRETHYGPDETNSLGNHYAWSDGRLANLRINFSELVNYAYTPDGLDDWHQVARTEYPDPVWDVARTDKFDVIVTATNHSVAIMQMAARKFLKEKYGVSWHWETRSTRTLLLRLKDRERLEANATDSDQSISTQELAISLENFLGLTVIDQTQTTHRYVRTLERVPAWRGRDGKLESNNAYLAQFGLELVETNLPQSWLIVNR